MTTPLPAQTPNLSFRNAQRGKKGNTIWTTPGPQPAAPVRGSRFPSPQAGRSSATMGDLDHWGPGTVPGH